MTPEEALAKAIETAGSQAELARRLGTTMQAVNQWKVAPAARVLAIEEAVDGAVKRHELRPDYYPPPATEAA